MENYSAIPLVQLFKSNAQLIESLTRCLIQDRKDYDEKKITEAQFKYAFCGAVATIMALLDSMIPLEKDIDLALDSEAARISMRKYFVDIKYRYSQLRKDIDRLENKDGKEKS